MDERNLSSEPSREPPAEAAELDVAAPNAAPQDELALDSDSSAEGDELQDERSETTVEAPHAAADADAEEEVAEEAAAEELDEDAAEEDVAEEDETEEEEDDDDTSSGIMIADDEPEAVMDWYILKVQSNREDSIREALLRRIGIAGLDEFFESIIVPVEMVTEFKGGKRRVVKRKLYPGYLVVHMVLNDDTWFLVRETPGIGDFTGSGGKPTPMLPHEVSRIVSKQEEKTAEAPRLKINFNAGDRVKITEGTFENFEGDVESIDAANGRVTVMINIFGRSTPVELEYWQIESL